QQLRALTRWCVADRHRTRSGIQLGERGAVDHLAFGGRSCDLGPAALCRIERWFRTPLAADARRRAAGIQWHRTAVLAWGQFAGPSTGCITGASRWRSASTSCRIPWAAEVLLS